MMPGRERNGKQTREGGCGQIVSNTSERLKMTLLEKSPLLTFKRTLTSLRVGKRLRMEQKR